MKYYLIRHGKTDSSNYNRNAYGIEGAPLNEIGVEQAKELSVALENIGIDPQTTKVACSELIRAVQTAEYAGFKNIETHGLLNEINTGDIPQTVRLLSEGQVPNIAKEIAKKLVENPPDAMVWVTHGLVIASIKYILGMTTDQLEPKNCEIVVVEF